MIYQKKFFKDFDERFFVYIFIFNMGYIILLLNNIYIDGEIFLDIKNLLKLVGYGATLVIESFFISIYLKAKIVKKFVLFISCIFFVLDCYCLINYNTILNYSLLEIILASNINEIKEYISVYFNNNFILDLIFAYLAFVFIKKYF